ncbi:transcription antitermination factor NusB [Microcella frigidaquae]|uniref:Transcription antitermination protein NusB n=1 Tax=Microcella frigidaquae TaxID=424758 RepID=A0A840XL98_9MICO|nr:N utilization substance protein B [Microcella frigidaquae]NHN43889.1 transcription antitermination factor NusB [Microcella frigidaquae]
MSARSKARKRALDMLYIADVRQVPLSTVLDEESRRAAAQPQRSSSWPYAEQIVQGVEAAQGAIDALIEQHAVGWTLARMPVVDRAILRLATWELRENAEVPTAVVIAEAMELASVLSTDDSAPFVNGVLGSIAAELRA